MVCQSNCIKKKYALAEFLSILLWNSIADVADDFSYFASKKSLLNRFLISQGTRSIVWQQVTQPSKLYKNHLKMLQMMLMSKYIFHMLIFLSLDFHDDVATSLYKIGMYYLQILYMMLIILISGINIIYKIFIYGFLLVALYNSLSFCLLH
jgi:hypothetical protein